MISKIKCIHIISLAGLLAMTVSVVLAESYSGRPTAAEMDDLVTLGTESGHGVYERCYATQYKTNPVTYKVDPPTFIGSNGWYFFSWGQPLE